MKQLYLVRHAKSSWSDPDLGDFDRPLNKRGKRDGPMMAERLAARGVIPQLIVASPAKRARKTARVMAKYSGYDETKILYDDDLYLGSLQYHLRVIEKLLTQVDILMLVGHNDTMTILAEYLSGQAFANVPTCGVVAVAFEGGELSLDEQGTGKLLFFDYPKKLPEGGR